tara:strand:+ start:1065 stop:1358 length:294 start_codon:yes stop_codon:yes gene_type:complete
MENENDSIGQTSEQFLEGLTDEELDIRIQCAQDQIDGVYEYVEGSGCGVYDNPQQTLNSFLDERERRSSGVVSTLTNNKVMLLGLGLLAYYLYTKRK